MKANALIKGGIYFGGERKFAPTDVIQVRFTMQGEGRDGNTWTDTNNYHTVLFQDFEDFIKASYALHVSPGVNPYNGYKTTRIVEIEAYLMERQPRWWAHPSLCEQAEDAPTGMVLATTNQLFCWRDQAWIKAVLDGLDHIEGECD